jgi:hypothetical protein
VLQGWRRYKNHPEKRIRERFRREARILPLDFSSALSAMERYFRNTNRHVTEKVQKVRSELHKEFGLKARLAGALGGKYVFRSLRREEQRLNSGWTYQPPMFVEKRNWEKLPDTPQRFFEPAVVPQEAS